MDNKEWLQSLKPGDKFCTIVSGGGCYIYTVKRITETQIITEAKEDNIRGGSKFDRQSGCLIGAGTWYSEIAQELTNEIIKERNRKYHIRKLNDFNFCDLTEAELTQIYNIVFKKG